jgi:PAS domain S-box-containing protein
MMNDYSLATTKELALLFDLNPQPMFVVDIETIQFLAVNDTMIRKYGYSRAEFLTMKVTDIRPQEDRDVFRARFYDPEASDRTLKSEWRHQAKDGTIFDVEISLSPLIFNERPARLVLAHDITDRKNAEREHLRVQTLEIELQKERELKQHKDRFVSALVHEFRTPLAMIRAAADMIQRYHERMTAERIQEKMAQIMEQVSDMQRKQSASMFIANQLTS